MPTIRAVTQEVDRDFYDTYQVTEKGPLTDHRASIAGAMEFFIGVGLGDRRITNMEAAARFPHDQSFRISHMGLHVQFSDPDLYRLFFRDCSFVTYIAEMPSIDLTASHFADPGCWVEEPAEPEGYWDVPRMSYEGGFTGFWPLQEKEPIPPRQRVYVRLNNGPDFVAAVREVETKPPKGFVLHIRPILRGVLTRHLS